jgi:hypothetical protein
VKLSDLTGKKIFKIRPLNFWKEYTEKEHEIVFYEFIFRDHSRYIIECNHTSQKSWLGMSQTVEQKPNYPEFYKRGKVS